MLNRALAAVNEPRLTGAHFHCFTGTKSTNTQVTRLLLSTSRASQVLTFTALLVQMYQYSVYSLAAVNVPRFLPTGVRKLLTHADVSYICNTERERERERERDARTHAHVAPHDKGRTKSGVTGVKNTDVC
jgi:hypothetical protein